MNERPGREKPLHNIGGSGAAVAASTAHPLATEAALVTVAQGGSAVDAAIAAQAVICTVMPHAGGVGGDLMALVHEPSGAVHAVNGTGKSPVVAPKEWVSSGGSAVTVPGLVDGWRVLHERWGRLPLATDLAVATSLAESGYAVDADLLAAVDVQRDRLLLHGGADWSLLGSVEHRVWRQPELAALLHFIGEVGPAAFYTAQPAAHIARAAQREGGSLDREDLASHLTETPPPLSVKWGDGALWVQPPSSQGVILAMAAAWLDATAPKHLRDNQHLLVEVTEAAFTYRDRVANEGAHLLAEYLEVDTLRAGNRGGPRGYLHTAGVAVADREGLVVSSLVSVFDDFGSAVFVPELGIVLNNRAAGFTSGANAARPGARPVHTLAPALLVDRNGDPLALATPGADGQVQTLLQVLVRLCVEGTTLDDALAALRWRSENGRLLVERGHPASAGLTLLGHFLDERHSGDPIFGAVVAAGLREGELIASADPRRNVTREVR